MHTLLALLISRLRSAFISPSLTPDFKRSPSDSTSRSCASSIAGFVGADLSADKAVVAEFASDLKNATSDVSRLTSLLRAFACKPISSGLKLMVSMHLSSQLEHAVRFVEHHLRGCSFLNNVLGSSTLELVDVLQCTCLQILFGL